MKKLISLVLVLMLAVSLFSGVVAEEKLYIPVISKGFQHAFWQAVEKGASAAATDLGVNIYFVGPVNETDIEDQVAMLKAEMAKSPAAIALAALSTDSVMTELQECVDKKIPVIGFDSGVPNAPAGAIYATASTNNQNAAALAAEKFMEVEGFTDLLFDATAEKPVVIAAISQDATSESVTSRTTGFVNKMKELASEYGTVSIEGHELWADKVEGANIIIHVEVGADTSLDALKNSTNYVLSLPGLKAIFCSNEGAVNGCLAATSDGAEFGADGQYKGILVAGFDAGTAQKNAVRNGWFVGSVTQDPFQIGYKAVELAVKAAKGEAVADVDTGAQWYTSENIDTEQIAMLVYEG